MTYCMTCGEHIGCDACEKRERETKTLLDIAEKIIEVINTTRPFTRTAGQKVYWDREWLISEIQSRKLNDLITAFQVLREK